MTVAPTPSNGPWSAYEPAPGPSISHFWPPVVWMVIRLIDRSNLVSVIQAIIESGYVDPETTPRPRVLSIRTFLVGLLLVCLEGRPAFHTEIYDARCSFGLTILNSWRNWRSPRPCDGQADSRGCSADLSGPFRQ